MCTHNLCFKISEFFLSENFPFLVVKFSMYLNRRVFAMRSSYLLALLSRFLSISEKRYTIKQELKELALCVCVCVCVCVTLF